jgi:4-methyl-5(b-hydroxyethyl)-thiazole monophosphate biosynthesis
MPGTRNLAASPALLGLVRTARERGALCAAICAAPLVLAKAGILKGARATCYPGVEKELDGAIVVTDQPVVVDGAIITSRGVGTAIPFALELIAYLADKETAKKIAGGIVYP